MSNERNLIPFNQRTAEEQREIARKGGIASGVSRRAYKSLKQAAKVFFKENDNAAMAVVQALYSEAVDKGNVKAADKLQDLIGETVQREELALKKKALQHMNKSQNSDNKSTSRLYEILGEEQNECNHGTIAEAETGNEMAASEKVSE